MFLFLLIFYNLYIIIWLNYLIIGILLIYSDFYLVLLKQYLSIWGIYLLHEKLIIFV